MTKLFLITKSLINDNLLTSQTLWWDGVLGENEKLNQFRFRLDQVDNMLIRIRVTFDNLCWILIGKIETKSHFDGVQMEKSWIEKKSRTVRWQWNFKLDNFCHYQRFHL